MHEIACLNLGLLSLPEQFSHQVADPHAHYTVEAQESRKNRANVR